MKTEYRYAPKVRELRQARGWTQEHLASVAGVTPRTIQRIESDRTRGLEALMAVAQALDTTVGALRTKFWVAESKPLQALTIQKADDFEEATSRAHHDFMHMLLAPLSDAGRDQVERLTSEILADLDICADDREMMRGWIESARGPFTELRRMGLQYFSVQERRDRFLKGTRPGERIPVEDWGRCYFAVVPEHGCFHMGGRGSTEPVHRFNPDCPQAIEAVRSLFGRATEVGVFATDLHAIRAAGGEEHLRWCDNCFPLDDTACGPV